MRKQGESWWMGLTATLLALACACSAIGIASVWSLARRMDEPQPAQQMGQVTPDSFTGQIAYVGTDGNIYTITPDGSDPQAITRNRPADPERSSTLAWSPDGQLAFASTNGNSALFTVQPGGRPVRVYSGSSNAAPFYLYWSPDGQRIAFLTSSQRGQMSLWLAHSRDDDSAQSIATGSPSYFSWSPDSRSLLMHIGGAQSQSQEARVAIFQAEPSQTIQLPDAPGSFQAPAWSPDGQRFLLARETEQGNDELVLAEGDDRRVLTSSRTGILFTWSPRGDRIALARPSLDSDFFYESVIVLTPDLREQHVVARGQVIAFFWSPDASRLAVLSIDEGNRRPVGQAIPASKQSAPALQISRLRLAWSVINVADGAIQDFPSFRPTDPFLGVLPYFDQYAQSLSLWSPDSRYLVFADLDEHIRPTIRVLDTTQPQQPARRVADGTFAAWSWR